MKKLVAMLLFLLFAAGVFVYQIPKDVKGVVTSPVGNTILESTPQNKQDTILFVSDRNGNRDIYMMDLVTKKQTALTTESSDEMNPRVSPDGTSIVYYSNRDGNNEIFEMDLHTMQVRKMTDSASDDYDPSYSFDGTKIIFKSDRDDQKGDIFLMNRDGTGLRNLTPKRNDTEEWDPVFSPDGSIFFVVRKGTDHTLDELYRMETLGSAAEAITSNRYADWYPDISATGDEMVYISKAKNVLEDDLFLMNLLTMESTRLTTQEGNDADPSFNRLGKKIIFINDKDGDYDLYMMNVDGSGIQKILNTSDEELSPVFL